MRPLLKLSYALNRSFGGLFGFHLVNLLLHGANVLLVLMLLQHLLPTGQRGAAFAGALLFALHPVNTEVVTMLSGRSVSLAAMWMLGSMVARLRGSVVLSLLAFALAIASRETALVLPALLTLVLYWQALAHPGQRDGAWRAALRGARWHWLICARRLAAGSGVATPSRVAAGVARHPRTLGQPGNPGAGHLVSGPPTAAALRAECRSAARGVSRLGTALGGGARPVGRGAGMEPAAHPAWLMACIFAVVAGAGAAADQQRAGAARCGQRAPVVPRGNSVVCAGGHVVEPGMDGFAAPCARDHGLCWWASCWRQR